jgi:uncharacterized protein YdhG (YjbR/CyaY superfamily)
MAKPQPPKDIDEYIARFPAEVQAILQKVRATIRNTAPEAKETISYQMSAFKQHGILVYFAGWQKHIGLYPPVSGDKALEKAVARYSGPKGNLQFPLDEPIPYDLVERIVKLRVKQDLAKAAAKRKKRKKRPTATAIGIRACLPPIMSHCEMKLPRMVRTPDEGTTTPVITNTHRSTGGGGALAEPKIEPPRPVNTLENLQ